MGYLLEMGLRRRKEFIEKRNIADSGMHAAHQALDNRHGSNPKPLLRRNVAESFPAAQKEPCLQDAARNDRRNPILPYRRDGIVQ